MEASASKRSHAEQQHATTPGPEDLVRVVALDGPAGTGKSSVSRRVAELLGWRFVDTGATYRAVTLAVLRQQVSLDDIAGVIAAARDARVELRTDPMRPGVLLDGADVSLEIRGPAVTAAVSAVSAVPEVRETLIQLQRRAMGVDGSVVEGRDIATVVAPLAAVKVYLDARPEVRALRRAGELEATPPPGFDMGEAAGERRASGAGPLAGGQAAVQEALLRRDALDHQTNRLEVSDGAVHIDTSEMTLHEVAAEVVRLVVAAGLVSSEQLADAAGLSASVAGGAGVPSLTRHEPS